MNRHYTIEGVGHCYPVTGRERKDGKVLFQIYGSDKKVWRPWRDASEGLL